jgi:hypothetical protein
VAFGHHDTDLMCLAAQSSEGHVTEAGKPDVSTLGVGSPDGRRRQAGVAARWSRWCRLDEACWNLREPIQKLVVGEKTNIKASIDIVHTDGDIYVAVKVIDPDWHLKFGDPPEEYLPLGDSVELFVDVLNNREAVYNYDEATQVYALWVTPLNRVQKYLANRRTRLDRDWDFSDVC